jgi:hypothetical protein
MTELEIAKVEYNGRIVNRDQKRYFPIVDIIKSITDTDQPSSYWAKMRQRDLKEVVPFWHRLKVLYGFKSGASMSSRTVVENIVDSIR